eukprot:6456887-Pyramimonas_sp.AAC.1
MAPPITPRFSEKSDPLSYSSVIPDRQIPPPLGARLCSKTEDSVWIVTIWLFTARTVSAPPQPITEECVLSIRCRLVASLSRSLVDSWDTTRTTFLRNVVRTRLMRAFFDP